MIVIFAVYSGFRNVLSSVPLPGGNIQTINKKLFHWTNIRNEKNELISTSIESPECKTYENANPIQFRRYKIVCSECTEKKILRPSSCELIAENNNSILLIGDAIKAYKNDMARRIETKELLLRYSFSPESYIDFLLSIVDKQKQLQK